MNIAIEISIQKHATAGQPQGAGVLRLRIPPSLAAGPGPRESQLPARAHELYGRQPIECFFALVTREQRPCVVCRVRGDPRPVRVRELSPRRDRLVIARGRLIA